MNSSTAKTKLSILSEYIIYYKHIYIIWFYIDFNHNKLSKTQHNELNEEFNNMYNGEILKERRLIDKNNLNCMYYINILNILTITM